MISLGFFNAHKEEIHEKLKELYIMAASEERPSATIWNLVVVDADGNIVLRRLEGKYGRNGDVVIERKKDFYSEYKKPGKEKILNALAQEYADEMLNSVQYIVEQKAKGML